MTSTFNKSFNILTKYKQCSTPSAKANVSASIVERLILLAVSTPCYQRSKLVITNNKEQVTSLTPSLLKGEVRSI